MLACRVVCCSHQSDRRIWVSRTNHIATLGYVTRTQLSQHLDTLHQSQHLGIVFFQLISWN